MQKLKLQLQSGMVLLASVLLTTVLSATALVLINVTIEGQESSAVFFQTLDLINEARTSQSIIERNINNQLDNIEANGGNLFFVDQSESKNDIVNNTALNSSTITDIRLILFEDATQDRSTSTIIDQNARFLNSSEEDLRNVRENTMQIRGIATQQGNYRVELSEYTRDTNDVTLARYNINIGATVCNTEGGCQERNKTILQTRTCPQPADGNGIIEVVEASNLPTGSVSNFPDLYCACSASTIYDRTTANGLCEISICPDGQFMKNGGCVPCPAQHYCTNNTKYPCENNCNQCDQNNCLQCTTGYFKLGKNCYVCPTGSQIESCPQDNIFNCTDGYYRTSYTSGSNIPIDCYSCQATEGVINCDKIGGKPNSCKAGYELDQNNCRKCQVGTYNPTDGANNCSNCPANEFNTQPGSLTCIPCGSLAGGLAATCDPDGTISSCKPGNGFTGTTCVPCGANELSDGTTACQSCLTTGVASCDSTIGNPISCINGYFLYNNTCNECTGNQYWNGNSCQACPANNNCSNGNIITCSAGYELTNNNCSPCPAGTYSTNGNACISCLTTGVTACDAKSGNATACDTANNYVLQNNNCIVCSGSNYWNGTACVECLAGATCSSSGISCDSTLQYLDNGQCVTCTTGIVKNNVCTTDCSIDWDSNPPTAYYKKNGVCNQCLGSVQGDYNQFCIRCPESDCWPICSVQGGVTFTDSSLGFPTTVTCSCIRSDSSVWHGTAPCSGQPYQQ